MLGFNSGLPWSVLCGFSCNIACCTPIEDELWGALHDLSIAWDKGYRKVCLEMYSKMVVRWLKSDGMPRLSLANLIEQCQMCLKRQCDVQSVHAFRECNQFVDSLASEALNLPRGSTFCLKHTHFM